MNRLLLKDRDAEVLWKQATVSTCETHHLIDNVPCYEKRFHNVLKFHEPGYAPVSDNMGAYHIDISGNPIYPARFLRTFGFYEGRAAVVSQTDWFHILPNSNAVYEEKYAWCGNFQEGLCPVRDQAGNYFHITRNGERLYAQNYHYVGDFRDSLAVVCREDGKSSHIDINGELIHNNWFLQLDVFHKGFARAKDERGWFHIKKDYSTTPCVAPAYPRRFANLELFYNGQAHAEDFAGNLIVIDEVGQTVREIFKAKNNLVGDLSSDLIGFWKAETIKLAVELRVLDHLPGSARELEAQIRTPAANLERLLRALWEIGIVEKCNDIWTLTEKGKLLVPKDQSFLVSASFMWSHVQKEWPGLKEKLTAEDSCHHPTFKEETTDEKSLAIYRRALEGYANEDFSEIAAWKLWQAHAKLLGLGQTGITVITSILKAHPLLEGIMLNENRSLYHVELEESIRPRVKQVFKELSQSWDVQADAILLPRFLHYFPDEEASQILYQAHDALIQHGTLYIFEMFLDLTRPEGSLLDLNMLAESGGKLRSLCQWKELLAKTGFFIERQQTLKPHLQLIVGKKS